jgi:uncharacterized membrane protein
MSELLIVVFPNDILALEAAKTIADYQDRAGKVPEDIVVVQKNPEGGIALEQVTRYVTGKALGDGRWGTLIGMLFLDTGKDGADLVRSAGLDKAFVADLADALTDGRAAMGMRVSALPIDQVLERLGQLPRPGTVLRTTLSRKAERVLGDALKVIPDYIARP